jgi:hypothetical protein
MADLVVTPKSFSSLLTLLERFFGRIIVLVFSRTDCRVYIRTFGESHQ